MKLVLEVIEGGKRSLFREIEGRPHVIGRDLTADIPVADQAFSRRHAIFLPFKSGWAVMDLGSTNGSWINGNKLEALQPYILKDTDFLQLADVAYKIRCFRAIDITIPSGFRLFAVRGESETIELDPDAFDGSIVTEFGIAFEMNQGGLYLEIEDSETLVLKNGVKVSATTQVIAGDIISCHDFQFLVVFGSLSVISNDKSRVVAGTEKAKVVQDLVGSGTDKNDATVYDTTRTSMIEPERFAKLRFGDASKEPPVVDEDVVLFSPQKISEEKRFTLQAVLTFIDDLNDNERRLLYGIIFFIGASLFLFLMWLIFLR